MDIMPPVKDNTATKRSLKRGHDVESGGGLESDNTSTAAKRPRLEDGKDTVSRDVSDVAEEPFPPMPSLHPLIAAWLKMFEELKAYKDEVSQVLSVNAAAAVC